MIDGGLEFQVHALVRFRKVEPLFGVAEHDVTAADGHEHRRRSLPGIGSLVEPVHVLRAGADVGPGSGFDHKGERAHSGQHQDLVACVPFNQGKERV